MNRLQYAIAEGFVSIFFWEKDGGDRVKGAVYSIEPKAAVSIYDTDIGVFTIFGDNYFIDTEFYYNYGTKVDSKAEADRLGALWMTDKNQNAKEFVKNYADVQDSDL